MISFLDNLIDALSTNRDDRDYIAQRMASLNPDGKVLKKLALWDDSHYTRNIIKSCEDYEIALLCWEPGQGTRIHDHNSYDSWVTVLDGVLREKRYVHIESSIAMIPVGDTALEKGKVAYINDGIGAHAFKNSSGRRVISLHVYGGYIEKCRVYDPHTAQFKYVNVSAGNLSATHEDNSKSTI